MLLSIKNIVFIAIIVFVFASCEKEDQPIKLPPRGNSSFMSITLGKDFEKQAFLNLKDSQITLVDINSWDLAFDASPFGSDVYLNGGMDMYAADTKRKNFFITNNTDTFNYKWDSPCGCKDSLALSHWCDFNRTGKGNLYMLDRGSYYTTNRFIEFRLIQATPYEYLFEYAYIDNQQLIYKVTLPKDPSKTKVYYSFTTPNTYINFEPQKDKWDLCFLKYRYVFYETNVLTKYVVRGIFINSSKISVAVDSTNTFESITPSMAVNNFHYSDMRDVIGYDWKIYNFTTGQYNTRANVNYIIYNKYDQELYKLRFLDFNLNGVKGTPKFEYVGLN
ncbi:MAG: hypothetical protein V4538_01200 [Bacteroidota bacterium]